MQAAAETTESTASGSTGKEDLKADRGVRHCKEVGRDPDTWARHKRARDILEFAKRSLGRFGG